MVSLACKTGDGTIRVVGLDADDTLWENEGYFRKAERDFVGLVAEYGDNNEITRRLYEIKRRNLSIYGFGIKGFTLSMIETAIEVSDGRLSAALTGSILELGRDMLTHPVDLIDGVGGALGALAGKRLVLITKGDLIDQQRKIEASGLAEHFEAIEILPHKTASAYQQVLARHGIERHQFLMVGNSVVSDILPVLKIGAKAVLIPHDQTWEAERADEPQHPDFYRLDSIRELPGLIERIEAGG